MLGARLVIYREMDLIHYVYTERLDNDDFIGFCLIFNKVRITRPRKFIKLCRFIIEKRMIEAGNIVRYDENGDLKFVVKALNENIKEYDALKGYINTEFENRASEYGIEPLTTIYNGVKLICELDRNASDGQIISSMNNHNKVVVNDDAGIEHGYIPQVIKSLREQNKKSLASIGKLQEENLNLQKQKKQYRYVMFLMLAILGCGVGLFFLNDNLKKTKVDLSNAQQTIINNEQSISKLNKDIKNFKEKWNSEKELREKAESDFASFKNLLNDRQPFIVKGTSFSFDTGYLSFDYYGLRDETVTLKVKAFKDGRSYSNSTNMDVKKGHQSFSIYVSSSLSGSDWYSFELLVGNIIVGGDRH